MFPHTKSFSKTTTHVHNNVVQAGKSFFKIFLLTHYTAGCLFFCFCFRVCPSALEAVIGLLSLGVPGSEVTSLTSSSTSAMDW